MRNEENSNLMKSNLCFLVNMQLVKGHWKAQLLEEIDMKLKKKIHLCIL